MKLFDGFFNKNHIWTILMSGFIGIFIYAIYSGDQFEDQTKFVYIGIGLPIWLIIRSLYWKKRNEVLYNDILGTEKQENKISIHNKYENSDVSKTTYSINESKEPVDCLENNIANQFSSEQEVRKFIEDTNDFDTKKKAIYSYAKNVLTYNEYAFINQIQSLNTISERIFWELIIRSNESGKSFYAGETYRIKNLVENNLISFDDQYKGKHIKVNILPESKRVYDFLKAFKPI